MRRASGLGAWVAKSFPLARPYHGLEKSPGKVSPGTLAWREGGRKGEWVEERRGRLRSHKQSRPPLSPRELVLELAMGATSSVAFTLEKQQE